MRNKTILFLGAAIALGALGSTAFGPIAFAQGASGPFTQAQVASGHQAFDANCAPCHLQDLSGTNDAPALAGTPFMGAWGKRTTAQLYSKIATTMPLGQGGSLSEAQYADIVAYILNRNGARAGNNAFTPTGAVPRWRRIAGARNRRRQRVRVLLRRRAISPAPWPANAWPILAPLACPTGSA